MKTNQKLSNQALIRWTTQGHTERRQFYPLITPDPTEEGIEKLELMQCNRITWVDEIEFDRRVKQGFIIYETNG